MHFEFLVEGQVELTSLSILLPKIIGEYGFKHTWKIHKHRGIGNIPRDYSSMPNVNDRTLLHNLPSKLRAYGHEDRDDLVVVVLVDLDERKDCADFKKLLESMCKSCNPRLKTAICIAIEELEAWFLGDENALFQAYPNVRKEILKSYLQDSQCGTWELLGKAVDPDGMKSVAKYGKRSVRVLEKKRLWAVRITPKMVVESNSSPSFQYFVETLKKNAM